MEVQIVCEDALEFSVPVSPQELNWRPHFSSVLHSIQHQGPFTVFFFILYFSRVFSLLHIFLIRCQYNLFFFPAPWNTFFIFFFHLFILCFGKAEWVTYPARVYRRLASSCSSLFLWPHLLLYSRLPPWPGPRCLCKLRDEWCAGKGRQKTLNLRMKW